MEPVRGCYREHQLGQDEPGKGQHGWDQEQVGPVRAGAGAVRDQGGPGRVRDIVHVQSEVSKKGTFVSGRDQLCLCL